MNQGATRTRSPTRVHNHGKRAVVRKPAASSTAPTTINKTKPHAANSTIHPDILERDAQRQRRSDPCLASMAWILNTTRSCPPHVTHTSATADLYKCNIREYGGTESRSSHDCCAGHCKIIARPCRMSTRQVLAQKIDTINTSEIFCMQEARAHSSYASGKDEQMVRDVC